jgi:DNA-binding transcriptional ArsR family regulator
MANDHRAIVALADPTRRQIFELVASRPRSVAELTRALPVTQSAVSQHLKVLKQAQLVRPQPEGTRTIYHVDPAGLGRMRAWLDRQWADALNAFKSEAENKKEGKK